MGASNYIVIISLFFCIRLLYHQSIYKYILRENQVDNQQTLRIRRSYKLVFRLCLHFFKRNRSQSNAILSKDANGIEDEVFKITEKTIERLFYLSI